MRKKKPKKKHQREALKKKQRIVTMDFDFGRPVRISGYRVSADGSFVPLADGCPLEPSHAQVSVHYERSKGPKILNSVTLPKHDLTITPDAALSKFDLLFAVDTNSVQCGSDRVSVACVVMCRFVAGTDSTQAQYAPLNCLEFRNVSGNPELLSWVKVVEMITANPNYSEKLRIGLIVDSELGKIPGFNKREKPIVGNFYLPKNFCLLYATADSGKEYLANTLLTTCDKNATGLLRRIVASPDERASIPSADSPYYSHFRIWHQ